MVKPSCLSKQFQRIVKTYNNYVLQGQIINTRQTMQDQQKINNPTIENKNYQKIDITK